ncbi:MAG: hypothetical protein FJX03_01500 [Alphaproteobacteria bacterium]|nr:hypothetical protein [Alphaproteobacteria bacterium]
MKKPIKFSLFFVLCAFYIDAVVSIENELEGLEKRLENMSFSEVNVPVKRELSHEESLIRTVIGKDYDRELVIRFIRACPSQDVLAQASSISASTISKLKNPQIYGMLEPSARRLWAWVQSKGIFGLEQELDLTEKRIKSMFRSLSFLDLSNRAIVFDKLGSDIRSENNLGNSSPRITSEVASYLNRMRGTFISLTLENNLLSDDGLLVVVNELANHVLLEEINIRSNKISDNGLRCLINLFHLEHLRKINIGKNFGPGELTLQYLREYIPLKNRDTLKIVIK